MTGKAAEASDRPIAIAKIAVERLFGHYTYDLRPADPEAADPRIVILYGDNGSGKTTIAQLLSHVLSPGGGRGHRTFLAQTRFERFSVEFDNGDCITAERPDGNIDGSYRLVFRVGKKTLDVEVTTSPDGSVKGKDLDDEKLAQGFRAIRSLPLCYFLSDNRVFQSDVFPDEEDEVWVTSTRRLVMHKGGDVLEFSGAPSVPGTRTLNVEPSIQRAETWMRRRALAASSAGEANISMIYTDILKRIAQPAASDGPSRLSLDTLLQRLTALSDESRGPVELGLASPISLAELKKSLSGVPQARCDLIANVLEPYVNSVRARLDAVAPVHRSLRAFLDVINGFYERKSVRLTVEKGVQVFDEDEKELMPALLSSGEKQLLLLLCNILVASDRPSLFVIDEPEISLNVKWQRELIDSLLQLVGSSHVQFVFATHSIELLTRHKSCVLRLQDRSTRRQGRK